MKTTTTHTAHAWRISSSIGLLLLGAGCAAPLPFRRLAASQPYFIISKRIDMASIVFFVGILLAVATLEHTHLLSALARWLDAQIGRLDVIVVAIGFVSAIVDNVPLVAASMGMYDLKTYPTDHFLWEFLAYCAGTGGSILIIGSAAGVAAMGLEKIEFFWYLRKISGLAAVGYLAGAAVYVVQYRLTH